MHHGAIIFAFVGFLLDGDFHLDGVAGLYHLRGVKKMVGGICVLCNFYGVPHIYRELYDHGAGGLCLYQLYGVMLPEVDGVGLDGLRVPALPRAASDPAAEGCKNHQDGGDGYC